MRPTILALVIALSGCAAPQAGIKAAFITPVAAHDTMYSCLWLAKPRVLICTTRLP